MKKYIKDISIFLMGIINATSIGVAAYTISAKEIGYSPKDSSWKVNNVADAIESLKTLKGGSFNYSTEEQVVGTWIDGKPLYQKTLTGITGSDEVLGVISTDLGDYCTLISFITTKDDAPFNGLSRNGSLFSWWIRKNGQFVATSFQSSEMINATFYATFQYTKTTDNATNS